jgi:hypothetical protein
MDGGDSVLWEVKGKMQDLERLAPRWKRMGREGKGGGGTWDGCWRRVGRNTSYSAGMLWDGRLLCCDY